MRLLRQSRLAMRLVMRLAMRLARRSRLAIYDAPISEMYQAITIRPSNDMPDTIPRIIQIGRADPPAGLGLFQKTIGIGTDLTILKRPWHRP